MLLGDVRPGALCIYLICVDRCVESDSQVELLTTPSPGRGPGGEAYREIEVLADQVLGTPVPHSTRCDRPSQRCPEGQEQRGEAQLLGEPA